MISGIFRRRTFLTHTLFWCVYFSFFLYQISFKSHEREWNELMKDSLFHVGAMMAVAYVNYFIFFPRFIRHKSFLRYLAEFSIPFAILITLTFYGKQYVVDGFSHKAGFLYTARFFVLLTVNTMFIIAFVAMLKFVEDWFELENHKQELEREKLSAELRFLKAQINPHFLFNTLNNLYYLAFTQSPNTPEVIAKLSQMMRYMIYDSNHATVPLRKELEYMENYIGLEQLRLNHELPITLTVNGDPDQVQVTPLILITFLENAFKHGVSNTATEAWIHAQLDIRGKQLVYTVENSVVNQPTEVKEPASGIGLANARRRLDLSYPDQYTLDVDAQPDRYKVVLTLQLT